MGTELLQLREILLHRNASWSRFSAVIKNSPSQLLDDMTLCCIDMNVIVIVDTLRSPSDFITVFSTFFILPIVSLAISNQIEMIEMKTNKLFAVREGGVTEVSEISIPCRVYDDCFYL